VGEESAKAASSAIDGESWGSGAPGSAIQSCPIIPTELFSLRIRLLDRSAQPRKHVRYKLIVGGLELEGFTDEGGAFEHQVPGGTKSGVLTYDDCSWALQIGPLAPPNEAAGAQSRLRNLGCGSSNAVVGVVDQVTRDALSRFQTLHDLDPSGELDDPTAGKLGERHGS